MGILLDDVSKVKQLAERLSSIQQVGGLSGDPREEAWALAITLADLERSFHLVVKDLLPTLLDQSLDDEGVYNALHDVGEELRHIDYHINNSKYYSYLIGSNE